MLRDLSQDTAYNITRYDHCLQAATRALRDGKDEEYVAVALLHDVCEPLGPFNHGEVIGAILRPFISRDNTACWSSTACSRPISTPATWASIPTRATVYKSDPAYEQTVEFCAKYDEVSFDPAYSNEPLSTFEPMVRRLLQKPWVPHRRCSRPDRRRYRQQDAGVFLARRGRVCGALALLRGLLAEGNPVEALGRIAQRWRIVAPIDRASALGDGEVQQ